MKQSDFAFKHKKPTSKLARLRQMAKKCCPCRTAPKPEQEEEIAKPNIAILIENLHKYPWQDGQTSIPPTPSPVPSSRKQERKLGVWTTSSSANCRSPDKPHKPHVRFCSDDLNTGPTGSSATLEDAEGRQRDQVTLKTKDFVPDLVITSTDQQQVEQNTGETKDLAVGHDSETRNLVKGENASQIKGLDTDLVILNIENQHRCQDTAGTQDLDSNIVIANTENQQKHLINTETKGTDANLDIISKEHQENNQDRSYITGIQGDLVITNHYNQEQEQILRNTNHEDTDLIITNPLPEGIINTEHSESANDTAKEVNCGDLGSERQLGRNNAHDTNNVAGEGVLTMLTVDHECVSNRKADEADCSRNGAITCVGSSKYVQEGAIAEALDEETMSPVKGVAKYQMEGVTKYTENGDTKYPVQEVTICRRKDEAEYLVEGGTKHAKNGETKCRMESITNHRLSRETKDSMEVEMKQGVTEHELNEQANNAMDGVAKCPVDEVTMFPFDEAAIVKYFEATDIVEYSCNFLSTMDYQNVNRGKTSLHHQIKNRELEQKRKRFQRQSNIEEDTANTYTTAVQDTQDTEQHTRIIDTEQHMLNSEHPMHSIEHVLSTEHDREQQKSNVDHYVLNIDHHMLNTDHHILNTDHHMLNTDHNMLNTGHTMFNTDHHMLNTKQHAHNTEQHHSLYPYMSNASRQHAVRQKPSKQRQKVQDELGPHYNPNKNRDKRKLPREHRENVEQRTEHSKLRDKWKRSKRQWQQHQQQNQLHNEWHNTSHKVSRKERQRCGCSTRHNSDARYSVTGRKTIGTDSQTSASRYKIHDRDSGASVNGPKTLEKDSRCSVNEHKTLGRHSRTSMIGQEILERESSASKTGQKTFERGCETSVAGHKTSERHFENTATRHSSFKRDPGATVTGHKTFERHSETSNTGPKTVERHSGAKVTGHSVLNRTFIGLNSNRSSFSEVTSDHILGVCLSKSMDDSSDERYARIIEGGLIHEKDNMSEESDQMHDSLDEKCGSFNKVLAMDESFDGDIPVLDRYKEDTRWEINAQIPNGHINGTTNCEHQYRSSDMPCETGLHDDSVMGAYMHENESFHEEFEACKVSVGGDTQEYSSNNVDNSLTSSPLKCTNPQVKPMYNNDTHHLDSYCNDEDNGSTAISHLRYTKPTTSIDFPNDSDTSSHIFSSIDSSSYPCGNPSVSSRERISDSSGSVSIAIPMDIIRDDSPDGLWEEGNTTTL